MRGRWPVLIVLYLVVLGGGWYAGRWLSDFAVFQVLPQNESRVHKMILTATAAFIVASAAPFVPGAEIGFALILVLGAKIAPLVYVSMVSALTLSFLVGKFVPTSLVAAIFGRIGFSRARDLVLQLAPLSERDRLNLLTEKAPKRMVPTLLRHRYLALMVLFNLPGNSAIGGGGGIAFTAGLSGLYSFPMYLVSVLLAVAPVPLFFLISAFFG